ncbi:MAG: amidohydrolase family protein [Planctomycetes bacterium]|nr:amidohydrolase family protein [Planctomycetota bacterium]
MRIVASGLATAGLVMAALAVGAPAAWAAVQDGEAGEAAAPAEPAPVHVLVRAERLIVRPGEVRENTSVLITDGRIVAIGPELAAPEGATVVEGPVVCAGFIDPWSALGMEEASRVDRGFSAATRAADGWNPYADEHLREEALRAGVTTIHLQGGSTAQLGGLGALVRIDPSLGEDALVLSDACLSATVGLSADGGFWGGVRAVDPFDRMQQIDRIFQNIATGQAYAESWAKYEKEIVEWEKAIAEKEAELEKDFKKAKKDREKDIEKAEEKDKEFKEKRYKEDRKPRRPKVDADKAVLARVASGEIPLVVEAHRASEIRGLLDALEAYKRVRLVIAGGTEALNQAERLAERGVTVIVWPALRGPSGNDEYEGHDLALAGELAEQGVRVLIGSGGREPAATRDLPLLAAGCVGNGLDRDAAFSALTIDAARALDVADRLGSVELGKDGELIVLTGEPLASATRVQYVISAGRVVVTPED